MSVEIDPTLPHYAVRVFLAKHRGGKVADKRVAKLLGLPTGPAYTTDLNAIAAALNERHCWWHLSHIEATCVTCRTQPPEVCYECT